MGSRHHGFQETSPSQQGPREGKSAEPSEDCHATGAEEKPEPLSDRPGRVRARRMNSPGPVSSCHLLSVGASSWPSSMGNRRAGGEGQVGAVNGGQ